MKCCDSEDEAATMKRFEIVHNIPSPYRLHLFETLERRLGKRGYQLFVHFMARGHFDREQWKACADAVTVPHHFYLDLGPRIRDKEWHLNPTMVARLLASPPDVLLVGGPWDSLTGPLITLGCVRNHRIAWFEANTTSPGIIHGPVALAKRLLLLCYDAFAVPNQEGLAYARLILRDSRMPRVGILPNLVDEGRFVPPDTLETRRRLRRELCLPEGRLALCVARFIWEKALPQFFDTLDPTVLDGWSLLLMGHGPLQSHVEASLHRFQGKVVLMASVAYDQMPSYYRAAELFVLPSICDRNPLSVVEALHSGLPLLLSNRVGNYAEALVPGENGWGFEPNDREAVVAAARQAFGTSEQRLWDMGAAAKRRAALHWSSDAAIDSFLDQVLPQ
jgi:glycosyltransferase involved in cell wall biosynthesis